MYLSECVYPCVFLTLPFLSVFPTTLENNAVRMSVYYWRWEIIIVWHFLNPLSCMLIYSFSFSDTNTHTHTHLYIQYNWSKRQEACYLVSGSLIISKVMLLPQNNIMCVLAVIFQNNCFFTEMLTRVVTWLTGVSAYQSQPWCSSCLSIISDSSHLTKFVWGKLVAVYLILIYFTLSLWIILHCWRHGSMVVWGLLEPVELWYLRAQVQPTSK